MTRHHDAPVPHSIVSELRAERERRGLTRSRVAEQMKVSANQLRTTEEGRAEPRISTLDRYAAAIGDDLRVVLVSADTDIICPNCGDPVKPCAHVHVAEWLCGNE